VVVVSALALALLLGWFALAAAFGERPRRYEYVDIDKVPAQPERRGPGPDGSLGSYTTKCGRNEGGHHNSDNMVTLPGQPGAAQHAHEYVGNTSTNAGSTDQSLAAAGTTCTNGDRSTYFWVVLRTRTPANASSPSDSHWAGPPHNGGTRVAASDVTIRYYGSSAGPVTAMPRFLRTVVGNAHAVTAPDRSAAPPRWGCAGFPDRWTQLYPICPRGQQLVRRYDFPSCWDGRHLDSANHRSHVVYPAADGGCPHNTFPIPQLRLRVSYTVPPGRSYAIDTFPEELRSPLTDHAELVNVMPEQLMGAVVRCINSGRTC
jgi:hypothetical protein